MKHRILLRICLLFTLILGTTGCLLDQELDFSFPYVLQYELSSEETEAAVKEYFKSKIDFDNPFTYTGYRSDAVKLANEQMLKDCEALSEDEIYAILEEGDAVLLAMYISCTDTYMPISGIQWIKHDEKQEPVEPIE